MLLTGGFFCNAIDYERAKKFLRSKRERERTRHCASKAFFKTTYSEMEEQTNIKNEKGWNEFTETRMEMETEDEIEATTRR